MGFQDLLVYGILLLKSVASSESQALTAAPTTRGPTAAPTREPTSAPTPAPGRCSPTYQCLDQGYPCCSKWLWCGNTPDHCSPASGCISQCDANITWSPTKAPSPKPSRQPSTRSPTGKPTGTPSIQRSVSPSRSPTYFPTSSPTPEPSYEPSYAPSPEPSAMPTSSPTWEPTYAPSPQPSYEPSLQPSDMPTSSPTSAPTEQPTPEPTAQPTSVPTSSPTAAPTPSPTEAPTERPTAAPSSAPSTASPTSKPIWQPSSAPTRIPSNSPTGKPSFPPTFKPTFSPTTKAPTTAPTRKPTSAPTPAPGRCSATYPCLDLIGNPCCSQYLYCGSTPDHCGTGCISNCNSSITWAPTSLPTPLPTRTTPKPTTKSPATPNPSTTKPSLPPVITSSPTPSPASALSATGWMYTDGSKIYNSDGTLFRGRGANIQDPRGCSACLEEWGYSLTDTTAEVKRRISTLVNDWGANFFRLTLEAHTVERSLMSDSAYFDAIKSIVAYVGTIPKQVTMMISLWSDSSTSPQFSAIGKPTVPGTSNVWIKLTAAFATVPYVIFGIANEPGNYGDFSNNSTDAILWDRYNSIVATIRTEEAKYTTNRHIIAVQGTKGFATYAQYYIDHPITAGGGANIVYEIHVYSGASTFDTKFGAPSTVLPMVIGEFGPVNGDGNFMTTSDCSALMKMAERLLVPWMAFTFHMRCPPSLLADNSNNGCGLNMALQPTSWGQIVKTQLGKAYGT